MYNAGLILEGGGMRGVYTAGVLDAFLDAGIEFSSVYGVSAGSCHACSYLSKQRGRAFRVNVDYLDDPNYCGAKTFLKTGNVFGPEMLYEQIPDVLDPFDHQAFLNYPGKFYAVVTDVETGAARYLRVRDLRKQMWMIRSSSSLPLVSKTIVVKGHKLLDGGIADSIPFEWLAGQDCDKLIVILTRDMEYRKKPMSPVLVKLYGRKYPKIAERLLQRHNNYNRAVEELRKWEAGGKAMVIRPSSPIEIGRIEKNPDKLQAVYELGAKDGNANLQKIKDFIK